MPKPTGLAAELGCVPKALSLCCLAAELGSLLTSHQRAGRAAALSWTPHQK